MSTPGSLNKSDSILGMVNLSDFMSERSNQKVLNLPSTPIPNVHVWQSLFLAMWRRMVSPTN